MFCITFQGRFTNGGLVYVPTLPNPLLRQLCTYIYIYRYIYLFICVFIYMGSNPDTPNLKRCSLPCV